MSVAKFEILLYNIGTATGTFSSVGRAFAWRAKGQRFESVNVHHVVADFVSFVTAFLLKKPSLIHAVKSQQINGYKQLYFIFIIGANCVRPFLMVYLYVEKIPQFYWGLKKALAKTEKAGKRPPKNVEEKLNLQV